MSDAAEIQFGEVLRSLLRIGGKTQRWLAGATGYDTSAVSRWVSGDRAPDPRARLAIATALGVPPRTLGYDADEGEKGSPEAYEAMRHRAEAAEQEAVVLRVHLAEARAALAKLRMVTNRIRTMLESET